MGGSKIGTPNGTLASGNMDQNLWSPGGLILTHTHIIALACTGSLFLPRLPAFPPPLRNQRNRLFDIRQSFYTLPHWSLEVAKPSLSSRRTTRISLKTRQMRRKDMLAKRD